MKSIRLSVTDAEYADYKAVRRNERIARRALKHLKTLIQGERLYNLKTDGGYIGVYATPTDFRAYGVRDGADVCVDVRLRPVDDASARRLTDIALAAIETHKSISDALLRSLSASMKRDITTLLDWASPDGVPLWRESIYVYVETSEKEERRRIAAARGLGVDDAPAAQ